MLTRDGVEMPRECIHRAMAPEPTSLRLPRQHHGHGLGSNKPLGPGDEINCEPVEANELIGSLGID